MCVKDKEKQLLLGFILPGSPCALVALSIRCFDQNLNSSLIAELDSCIRILSENYSGSFPTGTRVMSPVATAYCLKLYPLLFQRSSSPARIYCRWSRRALQRHPPLEGYQLHGPSAYPVRLQTWDRFPFYRCRMGAGLFHNPPLPSPESAHLMYSTPTVFLPSKRIRLVRARQTTFKLGRPLIGWR